MKHNRIHRSASAGLRTDCVACARAPTKRCRRGSITETSWRHTDSKERSKAYAVAVFREWVDVEQNGDWTALATAMSACINPLLYVILHIGVCMCKKWRRSIDL